MTTNTFILAANSSITLATRTFGFVDGHEIVIVADTDLSDTVGYVGILTPVRLFATLNNTITIKEITMNTFNTTLEELLISYLDAGNITEEVATHLNETAVDADHLEAMLVACVDSDTIELDVATNILEAINA